MTARASWSSTSTTTRRADASPIRSVRARSVSASTLPRAAELAKPGFKVMHIPDFDFRSTCTRFVACLQTVKAWSDAHPDHIPIADPDQRQGRQPARHRRRRDREVRRRRLRCARCRSGQRVRRRRPHHARPGARQARNAARGRARRRLAEVARGARARVLRAGRSAEEGGDLSRRAALARRPRDVREHRRVVACRRVHHAERAAAGCEAHSRCGRSGIHRAHARRRRHAGSARRKDGATRGWRWPPARSTCRRTTCSPTRASPSYSVRLPDGATTVCNPVRAQKQCGGRAVK